MLPSREAGKSPPHPTYTKSTTLEVNVIAFELNIHQIIGAVYLEKSQGLVADLPTLSAYSLEIPNHRGEDTDATMITSLRSKSAEVVEGRSLSISSLTELSFFDIGYRLMAHRLPGW